MPLVLLFSLSAFFSALILFSVQPFMAKMILPLYGGSPAVWNTAMVFYQAALLAGYAWVHAGLRWLGWRTLGAINLGLFLVAVIWLLPPGIPEGWQSGQGDPALSVLAVLCVSIGLPFTLVSCNAPLIQYWFSRSAHLDRHSPYFLYAASNLGSLVALLAYPFWLESTLRLGEQATWWGGGFALLGLLLAACLLSVWRGQGGAVLAQQPAAAPTGAVTPGTPWQWLLYAAVPSALLLAVTNHITTDIAAMPLLWVLPLALYLLTFVVAFSGLGARVDQRLLARLTALLAVLTALLAALTGYREALPQIGLNLLLLFAAALACHIRLVALRPDVAGLTRFYLYLSLGGLLGSFVVALLAPMVFDRVHEYVLVMVLMLFLLPRDFGRPPRWMLYLLVLATLAAAGGALWPDVPVPAARWGLLLTLAAATLYFAGRPWLQALLVGMVLLPGVSGQAGSMDVYAARSFYGAYLVQDGKDGLRMLLHGTTLHGAQYTDEARRRTPLTYYHPDYLMGDITRVLAEKHPQGADWAVVGLGTGAMACNARAQDRVTFFEIDPLMVKIASDPALFSYLRDCPPATRVVLGDARLTLAEQPDAGYDFLFLDAFSSDAIPVHVLTREAVAVYLRKLRPDGLLVFHISNRHLDLVPVMAGLAKTYGLMAEVSHCQVKLNSVLAKSQASTASMVIMGRLALDRPLLDGACWRPLVGDAIFWSDDYSNLWRVRR